MQRITVSLDALDDATFKRMNDVGVPVATVLDGIEAAREAGLWPIKVNAVVERGVNDAGMVDLARHFKGTGVILRFIEFMDVGSTNGWRLNDVVSAQEILERIDRDFPLRPLEANYPGEVARRWEFADGGGEIGVIASVTQAFCGDCSRLRLSTDGKLYTCLFATEGTELRAPMRAGEDDAQLRQRLETVWGGRTDRYSQLRHAATELPVKKIEMSYIGG